MPVVDDDPTVAEVVASYLDLLVSAVDRAADGPSAARAAASRPDLVVLERRRAWTASSCRRIREAGPLPVVMLTARGDEEDRIVGHGGRRGRLRDEAVQPREWSLRVELGAARTSSSWASTCLPAPVVRRGADGRPAAPRAPDTEMPLGDTATRVDLLAFLVRPPRAGLRPRAS